jgi:hypothetical protein
MAANIANMKTGTKKTSYKAINLLGATNLNVEGQIQTQPLSVNDNSVFDTSHLYMNSPAFKNREKIPEDEKEDDINNRQDDEAPEAENEQEIDCEI